MLKHFITPVDVMSFLSNEHFKRYLDCITMTVVFQKVLVWSRPRSNKHVRSSKYICSHERKTCSTFKIL